MSHKPRSFPLPAFISLFVVNALCLLLPESSVNALALFVSPDLRWVYSLFTHMFMHADVSHFLGNMIFVGPFAFYMEHKLGPQKFLQLWLGSGLFAAGLFIFTAPFTQAFAAIGSSGACAGIAAAAMYSFGKRKSEKALCLFALCLFFGKELFYGLVSILEASSGGGGIAYWAHVGGAIGALLILPHLRDASPRSLLQGAKSQKAPAPDRRQGAKKAALPARS